MSRGEVCALRSVILVPMHFDTQAVLVRACAACDCELLGVADNDTSCNRVDGQCNCKQDVTGRRCDICTDGYFGLLTADDPGTCKRQFRPLLFVITLTTHARCMKLGIQRGNGNVVRTDIIAVCLSVCTHTYTVQMCRMRYLLFPTTTHQNYIYIFIRRK